MPDTKSKLLLRDEDGRVLMVRDRKTQAWTLPGGKEKKGETPEKTLARELLEELPRMSFEAFEQLSLLRLASGDKVNLFTARSYRGSHKLTGAEIDMAVFVGNSDKFRLTPGTAEILKQVEKSPYR